MSAQRQPALDDVDPADDAPSPYADGYAPDPAWPALYARYCEAHPLTVAPSRRAEDARWMRFAFDQIRLELRARSASGGAAPANLATPTEREP